MGGKFDGLSLGDVKSLEDSRVSIVYRVCWESMHCCASSRRTDAGLEINTQAGSTMLGMIWPSKLSMRWCLSTHQRLCASYQTCSTRLLSPTQRLMTFPQKKSAPKLGLLLDEMVRNEVALVRIVLRTAGFRMISSHQQERPLAGWQRCSLVYVACRRQRRSIELREKIIAYQHHEGYLVSFAMTHHSPLWALPRKSSNPFSLAVQMNTAAPS